MSDSYHSTPLKSWGARIGYIVIVLSLAALGLTIIYATLHIRSQTRGVISMEIGNLFAESPRSDTAFALNKLREMADNSKQERFWVIWRRVEEKQSIPRSLYWDRSSARLVYMETIYTDWGSRTSQYIYSGVTPRELDRLRGENADPRYLKQLGCREQIEERERGKPGQTRQG